MVLAWTGNLDVDLAVARWGSERVGRTASALWAAGKLPPGTEGIELGGGRLLDEVRDDLDAGHWRVASWPASDAAMTAASIPFIGVVQGRPMPIAPGSGLSLDHLPHGATLVGLVRSTSMTARL